MASQALTSAANFAVGLILIRNPAQDQYGYYVLVTIGLLLLTGLQFAFLGPSLVMRLTHGDPQARRDVIGGMLREQRRLMPLLGAAAFYFGLVLWWCGIIDGPKVLLIGCAILAALAVLQREFFRMVLLAYRRPLDVLKSDVVYVVLLVVGALVATSTSEPAPVAVAALGLAALVGGALLGVMLWRHEGWNAQGAPRIVREIAPVGSWAVFGAGVHWTFSQGYAYVVAGILSVQAVAAIAATRLLLMPINLLSQGVAQVMLPTTSGWLRDRGPRTAFRRLLVVCAVVSLLACCYLAVLWPLRDWLFDHVMKRSIERRDALLALWSAIVIVMAVRDQLAHLLTASGRLRQLSSVTFASAVLSITVIYLATLRFGTVGTLAGILVGEVANVAGIIVSSILATRRRPEPRRATYREVLTVS